MTEGKPWEKIVAFTVPLVIGNIAQQLYNTVDSIIVGRYVGDNALAAVGSAGPILNLLLVLFIGISVGSSVMVSQYFGARREKSFPDHRKLYHPDRHCFSHYHGAGTLCDQAYAGASAYAGHDH